MVSEEEQLLIDTQAAQDKIVQSGIGLVSVESQDGEVLAAMQRIFGTESSEITFEMFSLAIKSLNRVGIVNGYENA